MNLNFFPRKGTLLECIKSGGNGDGQRVRAGQQYAVERIFTADSDDGKHGSLKVNGECAEVTVMVRPLGDSITRSSYPFRWDLERFRPVQDGPAATGDRAFIEQLYTKLEQVSDSSTPSFEDIVNEVEAYLSHTASTDPLNITPDAGTQTLKGKPVLEATMANMEKLAAEGARYSGEGCVVAYSVATGESYSANPADYWNRTEEGPLLDKHDIPLILITQFTSVEPA